MAVMRDSKTMHCKIHPEWIVGQITLLSFGEVFLLDTSLTTDRQAAMGHPKD